MATSESDFTGAVGSDYSPTYLSNVVTSSPLTPPAAIWSSPGTQKCVALDRKAYPSNHINAFNASLPESEETWLGIELACTDMALFTDIATAAGKNLTVASFVKAGYGLKNCPAPGDERSHFVRAEPPVRARPRLHGPLRRGDQGRRVRQHVGHRVTRP